MAVGNIKCDRNEVLSTYPNSPLSPSLCAPCLQIVTHLFCISLPLLSLAPLMTTVVFLTYLLNPSSIHRLVGYIEEEAVVTYTHLLEDIDAGRLPGFTNLKAPAVALDYWRMPKDASFRDLIENIRADEANHRVVNHTFASLHDGDKNPMIRL